MGVIVEVRFENQNRHGITSYKVYYLLYLIYIQHRLDNTIGKMFLDTFQNLSTLTLLLHLLRFVALSFLFSFFYSFSHILFLTMNRGHTVAISLNQSACENSVRRVYINYDACTCDSYECELFIIYTGRYLCALSSREFSI